MAWPPSLRLHVTRARYTARRRRAGPGGSVTPAIGKGGIAMADSEHSSQPSGRSGPLRDVRIVEIGGIGAGPFGAMVLADMGADVVRVDRPGTRPEDPLMGGRGKRSVVADLKSPAGRELVLDLVRQADGLIEAFRPGVAERLGIGPEDCARVNDRLVYGRATGWGQEGPWNQMAGHDINYIALSGVLGLVGRAGEAPLPPLNLVGDFGGGGLLLAFGMVCALLEARSSGQGQVVDGAMVDGSALLATMIYEMAATGSWREERGTNALDGGSPYYDTYETADGKWVAVGAMERQFFAAFTELIGIAGPDLPRQSDRSRWPELRDRIAAAIKQRTRDEWTEAAGGTDTCLVPVLSLSEVASHPHNAARGTFVTIDGVLQPAPAPRFSKTPAGLPEPPPVPGADLRAVLDDWGIEASVHERLLTPGL